MLNSSVKPTVLLIVISTVLSVLLTIIIFYMTRQALSENPSVTNIAMYFTQKNLVLGFVYKIIDDLSVITRYIADVSSIFLIAQLAYKGFSSAFAKYI